MLSLLQLVGPFLYGCIGGAVCCLAFFFIVFHRVEQLVEDVVRKKALKHTEFDAVAKAAAEVPTSKVETLCTIVRFDDDIVGEAIQCRAVFYGSTIFFYSVDELATLPDHRLEVRREHLLGKVNVSCVEVSDRRISKYHRHVNTYQPHAPVKGKCTILQAREGMPLFVEDPALLLKQRLEAARVERQLLVRELRQRVRRAFKGDKDALPGGPVNMETIVNLTRQSTLVGDGEVPAAPTSASSGGRPLTRRAPGAAARVRGTGSGGAAMEMMRSIARALARVRDTVRLYTISAAEAAAEVEAAVAAEPWLDSDYASPSATEAMGLSDSPGAVRRRPPAELAVTAARASTGLGRGGRDRQQRIGRAGAGRGWGEWLAAFLGLQGGGDSETRGRGRRGRRGRGVGRVGKVARDAEEEAARLAEVERTLYRWRTVAIKFPNRRENERWLNLMQSTPQTVQWRDFISHLPQHDVLNLLLARLFFESTRTSGLHDLLVKKIRKNLVKVSKGLQGSLRGDIYLDDLVVGGEVPLISGVSDPTLKQNGELEFDFDILYRGGLGMSIRFAVTFHDLRVPDIIFHIKLLELASRMRFNVGPPPTDKLWLASPELPSLRLEFTQEVASHEGFLNAVVKVLPDMSKMMSRVVKELLFEDMVLPNYDDFPWPVFDPAPRDSSSEGEGEAEGEAGGSTTTAATSPSASGTGPAHTASDAGARERRARGRAQGPLTDSMPSLLSKNGPATPRPTEHPHPPPDHLRRRASVASGSGGELNGRPAEGTAAVTRPTPLALPPPAAAAAVTMTTTASAVAAAGVSGGVRARGRYPVQQTTGETPVKATEGRESGPPTAPTTVTHAEDGGRPSGSSRARLTGTTQWVGGGAGPPTERARAAAEGRRSRRRAAEAETETDFSGQPIEFFTGGAGEVRRGEARAVFKSRGSAAVRAPASSTRRSGPGLSGRTTGGRHSTETGGTDHTSEWSRLPSQRRGGRGTFRLSSDGESVDTTPALVERERTAAPVPV